MFAWHVCVYDVYNVYIIWMSVALGADDHVLCMLCRCVHYLGLYYICVYKIVMHMSIDFAPYVFTIWIDISC